MIREVGSQDFTFLLVLPYGVIFLDIGSSLSLALMYTGFLLVALATANSLPHGAVNEAE